MATLAKLVSCHSFPSTIHDTAQASLSKGEKTGQVVTEFGAVLLVSASLGTVIPVSITFQQSWVLVVGRHSGIKISSQIYHRPIITRQKCR
jgi:hypothetical protein